MPDASLSAFLARPAPTILVEIEAVKGSSPREAGTFMLVSQEALWETIGGGQFEYMAIDHARAMLRTGTTEDRMDIPLGPEIGQCCGGRTLIRFRRITAEIAAGLEARLKGEAEQQPAVFIFGAGHVGKALADALSLLPLSLTVVETRESEGREQGCGEVECERGRNRSVESGAFGWGQLIDKQRTGVRRQHRSAPQRCR